MYLGDCVFCNGDMCSVDHGGGDTYTCIQYTYIYTYTYIYIYTYLFTYIYIYMHTYRYIHIHKCINTYIYIIIYNYMYLYIYARPVDAWIMNSDEPGPCWMSHRGVMTHMEPYSPKPWNPRVGHLKFRRVPSGKHVGKSIGCFFLREMSFIDEHRWWSFDYQG